MFELWCLHIPVEDRTSFEGASLPFIRIFQNQVNSDVLFVQQLMETHMYL